MTRSARYHARRRTALLERLGGACAKCGTTDQLEVHHVHNDGQARRAAAGNAGEITRLLGLPIPDLNEQAQLLCADDHHTATAYRRRFMR